MSSKTELSEFALFDNLQKYLTTHIEASRGVAEIKVEERDPVRIHVSHRTVEYDCHDIRLIVSNNAPTEPEYPKVVFTGLALFVDFGKEQDKVLRRWKEYNLPKVDLKNSDQTVDVVSINPRNQFPPTNNKYFPNSTHDEKGHGYSLFPGEYISYDMNVLLAECMDLSEMKIWVEATISRRHLFHFAKEITS